MLDLFIITNDVNGCPFVEIPADLLWDFVEYLSFQRIQFWHRFERERFIVRFPHFDCRSVRNFLDDWESFQAAGLVAH